MHFQWPFFDPHCYKMFRKWSPTSTKSEDKDYDKNQYQYQVQFKTLSKFVPLSGIFIFLPYTYLQFWHKKACSVKILKGFDRLASYLSCWGVDLVWFTEIIIIVLTSQNILHTYIYMFILFDHDRKVVI